MNIYKSKKYLTILIIVFISGCKTLQPIEPSFTTSLQEQQKKLIRKEIRQLRQSIDQNTSLSAGRSAATNLKLLPEFTSARQVACFLSFDGEDEVGTVKAGPSLAAPLIEVDEKAPDYGAMDHLKTIRDAMVSIKSDTVGQEDEAKADT